MYNNINLSDFALFLSVMKDKKAYQNALSIILDEADLKICEVKVEQVILNGKGKRAIRLDAWARTEDNRQFNMEMENHSGNDSMPKRSRFYQGLMDAPILKSGKNTRYKELPATVIIFITQDDIFGRDSAKYTFVECCEEFEDLRLGDGTKKIFLNMTSKNGTKELVSLLQYMKYSDINNPEILVEDRRIVELDKTVEVKSSEEWEAVKMTIYDMGVLRGIRAMILDGVEENQSKDRIVEKLQKYFELELQNALEYYEQYAKL